MKKAMHFLFIAAFLLCLLLPVAKMEFGTEVKSEIDNEYLPELETESFQELANSLSVYVEKRIGYREEALTLYQQINDKLFSIMDHPTYMYGEEGHVFFKGEPFIRDFQHLNLDADYAEEFAQGLSGFQAYTHEKGADFLYFYIPNKETIYPEYYPKGVEVYGDVSRTDQILQALDEKGVAYYFAKDVMLEAKKTTLVNNVKYDAGHWNDNGAFACIQHLYTLLQQKHPQLEVLEKEEFNIRQVVMKTLQVSDFEINESVPEYSLKQTTAIDKTEEFRAQAVISYPDNYVAHYENPDCPDQPKLLIFGDSYLEGMDHFFTNHFSEYTYIHRYNVYNQEFFDYYVDLLEPDIVIFENPERSHPIDLFQDETLD